MAAATGAFDLTESVLGYIRRDVVCAVCIGRMKLPPTRTDAREKAALFFWHGTCAAHEKASPSLHAARTLDVRRSTSCRRKCQHTGVPVLEEDRVLGGDRAPGVRVCPDTDVPGHCGADPIQWQSYRPACVFDGVHYGITLCTVYTLGVWIPSLYAASQGGLQRHHSALTPRHILLLPV